MYNIKTTGETAFATAKSFAATVGLHFSKTDW